MIGTGFFHTQSGLAGSGHKQWLIVDRSIVAPPLSPQQAIPFHIAIIIHCRLDNRSLSYPRYCMKRFPFVIIFCQVLPVSCFFIIDIKIRYTLLEDCTVIIHNDIL